jgi:molybdenum cofactor synthesis domain-containing protein
MTTAAVLIIGDEILTAKVQDENSPYLARQLRALGVDLLRICVIPDEVAVIAEHVLRLATLADHLITSGGIGPTHDDMTYEGVAAAFGLPMVVSPELEQRIREHMGERYNLPAQRMATVPGGSELWWEGEPRYPVVVTRNTIILPGVPALLRRKFELISPRLRGCPVSHRRLTTAEPEPAIADRLTSAARRWPSVAIGSYPQFAQEPWTVTITMDSRDLPALSACEAHLREVLGPGLVRGEPACAP